MYKLVVLLVIYMMINYLFIWVVIDNFYLEIVYLFIMFILKNWISFY